MLIPRMLLRPDAVVALGAWGQVLPVVIRSVCSAGPPLFK